MYIQEEGPNKEQGAPPDYRGHTYQVPERVEFSTPPPAILPDETPREDVACEAQEGSDEKSTPAGAFGARRGVDKNQKDGKRGDFFGNLGLSGLFSRVPFLSSLAPPPRKCGEGERRHGELWDWVLLAVVALALLGGRDDDVLPILLLLLLWD